MSLTNRMERNHTMVTEGRQRIVRILSTEYVDWLNEIRKLDGRLLKAEKDNERLREGMALAEQAYIAWYTVDADEIEPMNNLHNWLVSHPDALKEGG